jgi:ABC-2 type transport system permease protein
MPASNRIRMRPLLVKELREILSGRALWTMLLLLCPLVGYSFFQALALYGEASASSRDSPVLASGLSPLDGVLVPTFGALYLCVSCFFHLLPSAPWATKKKPAACSSSFNCRTAWAR